MKDINIPAGYKSTDIGVIPEDWEVKELSEIVESDRPISYGIVQTGKHIDNGIRCVRVVDIINGKINEDDLIKTSEKISNSYKRTILQENDLVIALRGKIGELAIISKNFVGDNLTRGVALIAPKSIYHSCFLYYYLSSYQNKSILEKNLNGSALKEISIGILRKIPAILPALPEQKALATALSDIDKLLGVLDRLIAKKQNLKQAAMQQLLTGKKRLSGFDGSQWQYYKLYELFDITAGRDLIKNNYSEIYSDAHPFPIYANSIFNDGLYGYSSVKQNDGDCITVTARGTLGLASYRPFPFVAIGRLIILNPKIKLNSFFLAETINHQIEFAIESTGVPQLTAPQISKYEVSIPLLEKEQKAIATILSDMDTEIAALKKRRDKTQNIKQAMMQELLTGKTRLVSPGGTND